MIYLSFLHMQILKNNEIYEVGYIKISYVIGDSAYDSLDKIAKVLYRKRCILLGTQLDIL